MNLKAVQNYMWSHSSPIMYTGCQKKNLAKMAHLFTYYINILYVETEKILKHFSYNTPRLACIDYS